MNAMKAYINQESGESSSFDEVEKDSFVGNPPGGGK